MKLNKKETPRWYFITSLIIIGVIILETAIILLQIIRSYYFTLTSPIFIFLYVTAIPWVLFNFFIAIYFLAKRYEMKSIILPIIFIVQLFITLLLIDKWIFFQTEHILFFLIVIGYSCYNLWKK